MYKHCLFILIFAIQTYSEYPDEVVSVHFKWNTKVGFVYGSASMWFDESKDLQVKFTEFVTYTDQILKFKLQLKSSDGKNGSPTKE
jgi:hypothetical protein